MILDLLAAAWWPALLAAVVSIGVTLAIERFGGKLGGLLGTLPTTIVPASLGMWTGEAAELTDAMSAVPPGMLVNAGFLWLWRAVPARLPQAWSLGARLTVMSVISLVAWTALAAIMVTGLSAWRGAGMATWILGSAGLTCLIGVGLLATATPRPAPRGKRRVGPVTLLFRGLLAGSAIGVAIIIARTGGSVAGGIASVFPAIFLTTMVSLWLSQGEAVPAGAVGPMMLGSASVGSYALLAALLYPPLGPLAGTVLAWILAVITTTGPAWLWLRRQDSRARLRAQAESNPPSTT